MKVAIIQFPGSNCERETILAIQRVGMIPMPFLWNESPEKLREMDAYVLVGGFSYEDRSRAGIIAALDPLMREIKQQSELGKVVLGICNGAQILVETGLVPGLKDNQLAMALTDNERIVDGKILGTGYYNDWVHLRLCPQQRPNAFSRYLNQDSILRMPVAHAEGRFVMPQALQDELVAEGLNLFQYCDAKGQIQSQFPVNPNGSVLNMAAVINHAGNVMAMMPHPERTLVGDPIFLSIKDYITAGSKPKKTSSLSYIPAPTAISEYRKEATVRELLVQLIITDNVALTVQNTLRQLQIPVTVRRMVHWQITASSEALFEQIKQTGVLYNDRKEYLVSHSEVFHRSKNNIDKISHLSQSTSSVEQLLPIPSEKGKMQDVIHKSYLVQAKKDLIGLQKKQVLEEHCGLKGIESIHHGILWIFESEEANIADFIEPILKTNIIFNPNSHLCYEYEIYEPDSD